MSDLSDDEIRLIRDLVSSDEKRERLKQLLSNADEIESIVENDRRMKWLWATIRRVSGTVAIIVAGLVAARDDIIRLLGWGG